MKKLYIFALAAIVLAGCNPEENSGEEADLLPDWYYAGGKEGTTTVTSS
ncbi:MAG: membrane lipoprotein lipid attachment site-containing protein, partial [Bacteroidales bacterium]|nr:membrane lipoprotein lipid attachment site-containing protein [Candidatus Colicola faecequi]